MLFSQRKKIVKEFHEWAENANKGIRGGKVDERDLGNFLVFLEIKGLIRENKETKIPINETECDKVAKLNWYLFEKYGKQLLLDNGIVPDGSEKCAFQYMILADKIYKEMSEKYPYMWYEYAYNN